MMKIDKLQLEIIIDNDEARQNLRKLEGESKQLKKELKKLPEGTDEWHRKKNKLAAIENQMEGIRHEIGLTGMSMKELGQRQRELNSIMRNMDPRTKEYKKLEKELRDVKHQQKQLRNQSNKTRFSFSKLSDSFNKYFGIVTAGIAAVTGLAIAFPNLLQGAGDFSDALADVQKTTDFTKEEVMQLNTELKKINTRSSRKELLELSRIAGKLGVTGVSNVAAFVKEADMINVALSEDLGGNVEEVIRHVGKLVDIFEIEDEFGLEIGLRKVGSAINALGAASTANEGYLVQFSKRFGGIAPNANISIQDTLGLASTLDQLGQTSEISTTALGKLMVLLGKDVPKFAKIAGIKVEEFSTLLEEDANTAMIKVFEGAKSTLGGLEGMAESLETMGVDGQRAIGVLGVLTNNIDLLQSEQKLANEEFEKGDSLLKEFNTKNNNLAGTLAKLRKYFYGKIMSGSLMMAIERGAQAIYKWTQADFEETIEKERKEVNKLVIQLTNSNTKNEDRLKILKKLRGINPKIVEDIDAENIALNKLKENLQEYNVQTIKKIQLNNLSDDEADQMSKIKSLQREQSKYFDTISQAMEKYNQDIAFSNFSLEEKIESTRRILELEKEQYKESAFQSTNVTARKNLTERQKSLYEIETSLASINEYHKTNLEIESSNQAIEKLEDKRRALEEILNVNNKINQTENNNDDEDDDNDDEDGKTQTINYEVFWDEEKLKEKAEELTRDIESWIQQADDLSEKNTNPLGLHLDVEDEQLEKIKTNAQYELELWEQTYEGRKQAQREMLDAQVIAEREYKDNIIAIEHEKRRAQMQLAAQAIGNMASIFGENTLAYKSLASAQALINTYLAASKALTRGPIIGPILAATITAQGLEQVAKINNVGVDKPKVSQAARGRYDVIGMDDDKLYKDVPFSDEDMIANNGRPALINETGDEVILNHRHVKNIQMNYPEVEEAIKSTYVPQRAAGNYQPLQKTESKPAPQQQAPTIDPRMTEILERNTAVMEKISKEGVRGKWVYRDFEEKENEINNTRNKASR